MGIAGPGFIDDAGGGLGSLGSSKDLRREGGATYNWEGMDSKSGQRGVDLTWNRSGKVLILRIGGWGRSQIADEGNGGTQSQVGGRGI